MKIVLTPLANSVLMLLGLTAEYLQQLQLLKNYILDQVQQH